jgi:Tfp pilus assembly protein PilZ
MLTLSLEAEFEDRAHLEREFEANLKNGGLFVPGASGADPDDACVVELVHPDGGERLELEARVVYVGEEGGDPGVGVAFTGFDGELRRKLEEFVAGGGDGEAEQPVVEQQTGGDSVHERLRGLSMADAHKVAREGEVGERVVLERIYGKAVWEPLLRNPRLTVPEVARIARMGAIPLPLLELIVANGSWLASPTVRRALLGNPRLSGEMMLKVLRATPRHELKLIPKQNIYSAQIKAAARKLLGI